ncbi:MAG: glycosyltransferase family 61 protein [Paracoccus sp. (in: a-proteobacteria)]
MALFNLDHDRPISEQTVILENGIYVPSTRRRREWKLNGGILTSDGIQPTAASCWHSSNTLAAEPPTISDIPPAGPSDPRTAVFLGHYSSMFGHFLLESTARLWWLRKAGSTADVALMLKAKATSSSVIEAKMQEFAELCGIKLPPFVWPDQATTFHKLVVPPQGSGGLEMALAAPEHRQMIIKRFASSIDPQGGAKIYISRSRLPGTHGTLIEEARLEKLLHAEGYEIFHPQEYSFQEQLARYKAAELILGVDGSAFHAVALVAAIGRKRISVIQRRITLEAYVQAEQLRRFGAADVMVIPGDKTSWSPAGIRRAALSMYGTLNFKLAGQLLKDGGFITKTHSWTETHFSERMEAIRQIGAFLGADMFEVMHSQTDLTNYPAKAVPERISLILLAQ